MKIEHQSATNQLDLVQILVLLRDATGHDFTEYKRNTVQQRVERRMRQNNVRTLRDYSSVLKANHKEIQLLLNELLINVTSFFRDPEAFDYLAREVIPKLFAARQQDCPLRIWVVGCATGEEAYSIAILVRELMDDINHESMTQIYATDLDQDAIETARKGTYPQAIKNDMSAERIRRHFHSYGTDLRINKQIRSTVNFAVQNVLEEPPIIKFDMLCCRNLMIYLESGLQNRLISKFNFSLRNDGVLFLSSAESVGNNTDLFSVISRKFKLYRALKASND